MSSGSISSSSARRGLFQRFTHRLPLKVYDDFCQLFLGREGVYYTVMSDGVQTRRISSDQLLLLFKLYHSCLRPRSNTITADQLSDWFHANHTARSIVPSSYEWDSFHSLLMARRPHKHRDYRSYFTSFSSYLNLFLSDQLELTMVDYGGEFTWGIVARKPLEQDMKLTELRGELIQITDAEYEMLSARQKAFSVLEVAKKELGVIKPPLPASNEDKYRQRKAKLRLHKRLRTLQQKGKSHSELEEKQDEDEQENECQGCISNNNPSDSNHKSQWQVSAVYRSINKGQELLIDYFNGSKDQQRLIECQQCK
jgi:hypothetical protein